MNELRNVAVFLTVVAVGAIIGVCVSIVLDGAR